MSLNTDCILAISLIRRGGILSACVLTELKKNIVVAPFRKLKLYQNVNISQNESIFDNKLKRFRKLFLTIRQNQTNLSK